MIWLEVGLVLTTIDGVARIIALDQTFIGELLVLSGVRALTLNLENFVTGLSILGNDRNVVQGDIAERSFVELLIEVGFGPLFVSNGNGTCYGRSKLSLGFSSDWHRLGE